MIKTLKGRLALWYTLLFTFMTLGVFFYIYMVLTRDLNSRVDDELLDDAQEIVIIFQERGLAAAAEEILLEVEGADRETNFYRIFSPEHEILAASDLEYWEYLPDVPGKDPEPGEIVFESGHVLEHEFVVRSVYCSMPGGYILQVGVEPIENGRLFKLFYETFVAAFVILSLASVLLGLLISKRAMLGLDRLRDSFERVGQGDFSLPVVFGREGIEIDTLIMRFNDLQHRIQTLIEELRNVTNDIAHDLRSPVTRIRGIAETTLTGPQKLEDYQTMSGQIIEECDTLVGTINTMLEIAESDAGVMKITLTSVDISGMVSDVADLFQPVAEDKEIELQIEIPVEPIFIAGDKSRLQRALANLLDNAIKYTRHQGTVTLSVSLDGSQVCIAIRDNGIGISEEDQMHIFDRFFRGDPSRTTPGNGLGLPLVRSIATLHHGCVHVESTLGEGSCFTLILPVVA